MRFMIHQRLKAGPLVESPASPFDAHLDEDTLCAFVEARLGETRTSPIISHLISCGLCRRTTAQMIRLESQFDEQTDSTPSDESPGRLRLVLDVLASRMILSSEEDAVFAYQNPVGEPEAESATDLQSHVEGEKGNGGKGERGNKDFE